jgi:hypothetical protein
MSSHPSQVDIKTLVRGFDDAHTRLHEAFNRSPSSTEDTFIPLFDTLNWAYTLSETGRPVRVSTGDRLALRLARNRADHQWGNALEVADVPVARQLGMPRPDRHGGLVTRTGPGVVRVWTWRRLVDLPPGDPAPKQEAQYVFLLEGKPAYEVLDRFAAALAPLR